MSISFSNRFDSPETLNPDLKNRTQERGEKSHYVNGEPSCGLGVEERLTDRGRGRGALCHHQFSSRDERVVDVCVSACVCERGPQFSDVGGQPEEE